MRDRSEIEKEVAPTAPMMSVGQVQRLSLEILLDIRDLLSDISSRDENRQRTDLDRHSEVTTYLCQIRDGVQKR